MDISQPFQDALLHVESDAIAGQQRVFVVVLPFGEATYVIFLPSGFLVSDSMWNNVQLLHGAC
jgi:hypothetical protein